MSSRNHFKLGPPVKPTVQNSKPLRKRTIPLSRTTHTNYRWTDARASIRRENNIVHKHVRHRISPQSTQFAVIQKLLPQSNRVGIIFNSNYFAAKARSNIHANTSHATAKVDKDRVPSEFLATVQQTDHFLHATPCRALQRSVVSFFETPQHQRCG